MSYGLPSRIHLRRRGMRPGASGGRQGHAAPSLARGCRIGPSSGSPAVRIRLWACSPAEGPVEAEGGSRIDGARDKLLPPPPRRGRPPWQRSRSGSPRPPRASAGRLHLVVHSAPSPVGEGGPSHRHRRSTRPPRVPGMAARWLPERAGKEGRRLGRCGWRDQGAARTSKGDRVGGKREG